MTNNKVKFIDLFAGLGGIRLGFESAFQELGFETECVMVSEIKKHANRTLQHNFSHSYHVGDIFSISNDEIPDFDFLLGGFPCQPFSSSGKRHGFMDTRGTLFFEIERILRAKKPHGFILENVEGLVKHDLIDKNDEVGRTFQTILDILRNDLGYCVSWNVLDSISFGVPQSRKRVFIVGTKTENIELNDNEPKFNMLKNILEKGLDHLESDFVNKLTSHFKIEELYGKSIKDKRGGKNNIHSWDIELKGKVSKEQKMLLNELFKQRRRKHWAAEIGIDWMDGMPLTIKQISTFFWSPCGLKEMLDNLVEKKYLRFEYPKKLIKEKHQNGIRSFRVYDESKPKGYNIVTGKLSFEINKILDPVDIAPTLVATDVSRLAVVDGNGLRRLTIREGLRLFGYPDWYEIPVKISEAFDLLGNTVVVPVVNYVAKNVAEEYRKNNDFMSDKLVVNS